MCAGGQHARSRWEVWLRSSAACRKRVRACRAASAFVPTHPPALLLNPSPSLPATAPFRATVSAGLMSVMIAQLCGVTDIHLLFAMFSLMASTQLFGWQMEVSRMGRMPRMPHMCHRHTPDTLTACRGAGVEPQGGPCARLPQGSPYGSAGVPPTPAPPPLAPPPPPPFPSCAAVKRHRAALLRLHLGLARAARPAARQARRWLPRAHRRGALCFHHRRHLRGVGSAGAHVPLALPARAAEAAPCGDGCAVCCVR